MLTKHLGNILASPIFKFEDVLRVVGTGSTTSNTVLSDPRAAFLVRKACAPYRWMTGEGDSYLGLFIILVGITSLIFGLPGDTGYLTYITAIALSALLSFIVIPLYLRAYIIVPFGIVLAHDAKRLSGPFLATTVLLGLTNIILVVRNGQQHLYFLVAMILTLYILYGAVKSGRTNLVFMALVISLLPVVANGFLYIEGAAALSFTLLTSGILLLILGLRHIYTNLQRVHSGDITQEKVLTFLESPKTGDRLLATAYLGNYLEPRFLKSLVNATHDDNKFVRMAALHAISALWGPTEDQEQDLLEEAFKRLSKKGSDNPEYLHMIKKMKEYQTQKLREHKKDVANQMQEYADDTSLLGELAAFVKRADNDSVHILNETLASSSARLLVTTRSPVAYSLLSSIISMDGKASTKISLEALSHGKGIAAAAQLVLFINSEKTWVATKALEALSENLSNLNEDSKDKVASSLVGDRVNQALNDSRAPVRAAATWLIPWINEEETLEIYHQATEDKNWLVRGESLCSFSSYSAGHSLPYLMRGLSDYHWYVRLSALRSLLIVKPHGISEIVKKMTQDTNKMVSKTAAQLYFLLEVAE